MNRTFLCSVPLLLAVLALPSVQSAELRLIVEFPHSSNVASTVTVGEILRGRQVQRVDVLLDRAVEFGPVSLHGEMAQMLSLLASPQFASEPPTSLLALEDHGPTIRVALSAGQALTIRRIHNDCYRFYWDGKTTWFRFGKSFSQPVQRTGARRPAAETGNSNDCAGTNTSIRVAKSLENDNLFREERSAIMRPPLNKSIREPKTSPPLIFRRVRCAFSTHQII